MRVRGREQKRTGAFTLIELLVVISILTFMAGMLLVVIHRTGERLKDKATRNALVRIEAAVMSFYQNSNTRTFFERYAYDGDALMQRLYDKQYLERKDGSVLDGWRENVVVRVDPEEKKIYICSRGYDRKLGTDFKGTDDDNIIREIDLVADTHKWTDGIEIPNPTAWAAPTATPTSWSTDIPPPSDPPDPTGEPLSATIAADPTSGTAPMTVAFTLEPTGGYPYDGGTYGYYWNFGDGGLSGAQNPVHEYSVAGDYTANVMVSDSREQWIILSVEITVASPAGISAVMTANPTSGEAELTVNFYVTASGGTEPYEYDWNFNDGGGSAQKDPVHLFADAGSYTVILTIVDANYNSIIKNVVVTVTGEAAPLSVSASGNPLSGAPPLSVLFGATGSGGSETYTYSWDFGDGSPAGSGASPTHEYTVGGSYTATVVVDDGIGTATDTVLISANTPLSIDGKANGVDGPLTLTGGNTEVTFTSTVTGGLGTRSYTWDFGYGPTAGQKNATHSYPDGARLHRHDHGGRRHLRLGLGHRGDNHRSAAGAGGYARGRHDDARGLGAG